MTCTNVYHAALNLIGESVHHPALCDYESRAIALLGAVFSRFAPISALINGIQLASDDLIIDDLERNFPLDTSLFIASAFALGSLLVIDEYPELSASLDERAEKSAAIAAKTAESVTSTKEVYPG